MKHRSIGGALISALFITAIAAMLATALAVQEHLLIHEGKLVLHTDQDYLDLEGAQLVAKNIILRSLQTSTLLPTVLPHLKINHHIITGSIEDEQGKFNLNNLINANNQLPFAILLQTVDSAVSQTQALSIAKAMTHWMTTGTDNKFYASLHPAYSSSKMLFSNISELQLIAGVTPEIFSALRPYITALPGTNTTTLLPININSATAPVFLTLNPQLTLAQAKNLAVCVKQSGEFANIQNFENSCEKPEGIAPLNNIATQSQYFLVQTMMKMQHHFLALKSLMVTQPQKNNTLTVEIVWQELL